MGKEVFRTTLKSGARKSPVSRFEIGRGHQTSLRFPGENDTKEKPASSAGFFKN
jgi:hypothetical protein